jgi:hypothetical protein
MSDQKGSRLARMLDATWSRQRFIEQYLGRFPREPHIQQEIGEKVMAWQRVTLGRPRYLILGINSYLRLYSAFFRDLLMPLGDGYPGKARYQGMAIIVIPVDEFVEVSSGGDWPLARYVRNACPHMGKGETENDEDDAKGLSTGPGGLCPDDGTPQGECWEGPVPIPGNPEA